MTSLDLCNGISFNLFSSDFNSPISLITASLSTNDKALDSGSSEKRKQIYDAIKTSISTFLSNIVIHYFAFKYLSVQDFLSSSETSHNSNTSLKTEYFVSSLDLLYISTFSSMDSKTVLTLLYLCISDFMVSLA